MDELLLIGWREWLALPALGLTALKAKIDTGARSSSLHVDEVETFRQDGALWLRFGVLTGRTGQPPVRCAVPALEQRDVTDSGGHRTRRWFIRTPIRLAGREWEAEVNLTDRGHMLFPMLLGRSALDGWCTVDPARSFLHGKPARRPPRHAPAAPSDAGRYHAGHAAR